MFCTQMMLIKIYDKIIFFLLLGVLFK